MCARSLTCFSAWVRQLTGTLRIYAVWTPKVSLEVLPSMRPKQGQHRRARGLNGPSLDFKDKWTAPGHRLRPISGPDDQLILPHFSAFLHCEKQ